MGGSISNLDLENTFIDLTYHQTSLYGNSGNY